MNTLNLTNALQDCLDEYLDELALKRQGARVQPRTMMQSDSSPDMEAHKPTGEFFCRVWKETVKQLQGNPIHTSNSQQMHSLSACLMEDDPNS